MPEESEPLLHLINPRAIKTFADVVFAGLEGFCPIRLLPEKGSRSRATLNHFPEVAKVAKELIRLAQDAVKGGFALCTVPATVARPGRARASDVEQTRVLLIDIDEGNPDEVIKHLAMHIGTPSLVVASGGTTDQGLTKLHAYWRLENSASGNDLQLVAEARRMLAEKVGADRSFASLHQPIRVPGSIHGKYGLQRPVEIVSRTGAEYSLQVLWQAISEMSVLTRLAGGKTAQRKKENPEADVRKLMTTEVRAGGGDGITRHGAMTQIIGHWIRSVRSGACTLEEARTAVHEHNQARISPPWPVDHLEREFNGLLNRDIENHGAMPKTALSGIGHGAPEFSEDAIAAEFVASNGENWKYIASLGRWFYWDGQRWAPDETFRIREAIRQTCRTVSRTATRVMTAQRMASAKTITAVERIIASDPKVSAHVAEFDAHPMLLNTPDGVVDLATGKIKPHDRSLLLTQLTRGSAGGAAPRFRAFLGEVTAGDDALIAYLQRLFGYALTGLQTEQIFAFFHGAGANGKSKLLEAVSHALGDYAGAAAADTFMAVSADRNTADLADLRAKRLVTVAELESGARWVLISTES